MTKRILAFLCVLALLMGTPISPIKAAAATTGDILSYCPCMGTHTSTSQCKEVKWEPWYSATTLPSSGNYYLTRNVYVPNSTELMGTLNLDLNGKTVKGNNGLFTMASGDHLVVTDSATGGSLGAAGVPVVANAGSKLTVYSAVIGGTVKDNGATVTLCGKPSVYISMADKSPAMKCEGLQAGSSVYVIGPLGLCFAKVSSADQKSLFSVQNEYGVRYENGGLYLTSKQTHCVCAGTQAGSSYGHVCEQVTWEPWVDEAGKAITDSLPTATGNYYLIDNVYLSAEQAITAGDTVRLDLNGKTVYVGQVLDENGDRVITETGIRAFYIPNGSTLELCSSAASGTGTLEGVACAPSKREGDDAVYGGVIYADTGSTLNLYNNITINGNRYTSKSTVAAYKRTATTVKGGCIYSLGRVTMYGGTVTNGSASGTGRAGGNIYTNGTFAMYGGKITSGVGTGINLYVDADGAATIGGTSYIYSGINVSETGSLTLTGAPHIPTYVYSTGSIAGISVSSSCVIDATGLDVQAMTQTAPNGDAAHCINVKASGTNVFAQISSPAQASFFESYTAGYGVHCDANGNISMHALTDARTGCLCGGNLAGTDGHTCQLLTWQPWSATDSLPTSGNYYLTADVAVTAATAVTGELNLDLYGHTVTATGSSRVYDVTGTLRITDSGSAGAVNASGAAFVYDFTYANVHDPANHGGVILAIGGTVELYGGTFTGADNVACGGVLAATDATVNLYGGTLTGSAAVFGGGLYLANTAFTMYGGAITGCSAGEGGSIYLAASCNAVIKGGTVSGGTANRFTYFETDNTTTKTDNAVGGNICVAADAELTMEGGAVTGGTATGTNGNGGNIAVNGTAYIKGGVITLGSTTNMGDNIYVGGNLFVSGGEVKDPAEGYNIGLWNGSTVTVSGGKISGGTYGIFNASKGGNTVLQGSAIISGTTYGIYMGDPYQSSGTLKDNNTLGTLTVDSGFTGNADIAWGSNTANYLGITTGAEIENTVSNGYTGTGNLICGNSSGVPLVDSDGGKLVLAAAAIADGDGVRGYYATFDKALAAYELASNSADQNYLMLLIDQTDVAITKTVYLDLNGCDISVASVSADCKIYGMDSKTNQYTQYAENGTTSIIGSLTLGSGVDATCMVEDVHVNLTKGTTKGTRKYLALLQSGAYTFHRYYLTLSETGLRPADAGIFYNATFYGDEAIAGLVESYGVEVSTASTFAAGSTASSNYQTSSAFQSGVLGNKGTRTVLKGILSENRVTPVEDYSQESIYGRAYLTVNGITLYCSNTSSTNLQSIITKADVAYGKNGLSTVQKAALDTMYDKYSDIMESWGILRNIGRVEIDINDLFAKDPAEDKELNILLIGNSFSFYWVEELFGLLAEGSGYDADKITITNVYYSGCSLEKHWNWKETGAANYNIAVTTIDGRTYDNTLFESLDTVITGSRAKSWDFISLQQNSPAFYSGSSVGDVDYARETLEPYLGNLIDYLRSKHPKAEYMWHQFWSHEIGHTSNGAVTVENEEERTAFHNAMVSIGNEVSQLYDMTVVPTGEAWELVRDNTLFTTLHASSTLTTQSLCTRIRNNEFYDDLYHDGDIGGGQYLNACVWYEKITGKSVVGTIYRPKYTLNSETLTLTEDQIELLQYAAHAAVAKYTPNGDPSLDDETNILLIGNSFSYWWTDELAGMLKAAGYNNVNIYNVYTSGCKLQQHWSGYQGKLTGFDNNGNGTLDAASDEKIEFRLNGTDYKTDTTLYECLTEKNWDMISLQQSGSYVYGGSLDEFRNSMEPYASNLLSTLRGMFPLAEYYWLQNWAHEIDTDTTVTGIADLAQRQEIANIFRVGSQEIAAKYSLTNVPCGDAWELVRDNELVNYTTDTGIHYDLSSRARASTAIYTDGKHDGDYTGGQYLNACVWFEVITGTSCIGNGFKPYYDWNGKIGYLSTAQMDLLQQAAHDAVAAVRNEAELTVSYLTAQAVNSIPVATDTMTKAELRQLCLDYMRLHTSFLWNSNKDFSFEMHYASGTKYISQDALYGGLIYQSQGTGNLYRALEYYDEKTGTFDLQTALEENGGFDNDPVLKSNGFYRSLMAMFSQCSVTAWWGLGKVINSANYAWTYDMTVANGFIPVGCYTYGYTHTDGTWYGPAEIKGWGGPDEDYNNPGCYDTPDVITDWIDANGDNAMYDCYAQMKPGDVLVNEGHTMMVESVNLYTDADGNVDYAKSTVSVVEQTEKWSIDAIYGGKLYRQQGNQGDYLFSQLQKNNYIPFTFIEFLDENDPQDKKHIDYYNQYFSESSAVASQYKVFKFSTDELLAMTGTGVEKSQVFTTLEAGADSVTYSEFAAMTVGTNYSISDVFVRVKDAEGTEVLKNVYRATSPQIREVSMTATNSTWKGKLTDGVQDYADGNHTLEITIQISTGELLTAFSGTLNP